MSKGKGQALGSIFGNARTTSKAGVKVSTSPADQTPSPPRPTPASVLAFMAVVDRVEAVLDAEIEILATNLPADISEIGNRKRQGLLEMSRALKAVVAAGARPDIRERLGRFARTVERNRMVLGTQLRAAREIAEIIAQTMREAESDGTYSQLVGRS